MKKLMIAFLLCSTMNVWAGACSKMVAFGTPIVQTEEKVVILCRKLYEVGYSPSRKTAYWVVEKVTVENLVDRTTRKNVFKTDPDIPTISAKPTDYDNSNFDQGHLAPATNMAANQQAMDQSFYLTNIIPQNPSNNQSGWKKSKIIHVP